MREDIELVADPLPDYSDYRDRGCDLFPSCLKCPMPKCRHDLQAQGKRSARMLRNKEIFRQRITSGKSTAYIAAEFDLSKRTIQRIVRRLSDE